MKETKKEAKRWFLQAKNDYLFVSWILKQEQFYDKGCFISQQAGEKALKACLYAKGKRYVIGHSLFEMAYELSETDDSFSPILNEVKRLDRFYIPTRYPNGLPGGSPFEIYSQQDLADALHDLKKIMNAAKSFLRKHHIDI